MDIINRTTYIDRILRHLGQNRIIILTGQRRVGKSYLLRSLRNLLNEEEGNNVVFIDKEKRQFDSIATYRDLNAYIDENIKDGVKNFVLIDEIQDIGEFERSLRAFYEEENLEIIVTGSNSKMLSSELSSVIGGRYKEIYVQSLTYREFLVFHGLKDKDESLSKYLRAGGLPGLRRIGLQEDDVLEYQNDVVSTVLLKDIILRQQVRNAAFIQNLLHYLADNDGKLISSTNVARYMAANKNPVSVAVVGNYLEYLQEAYLVSKACRYDVHGKKIFESNEKYYFQDLGIRNCMVRGVRMWDIEKVIENAVFNQLIFWGYEVKVGQLRNNREVDFIANRPGEGPVYIQVAYLIASEETYAREFGNLKEIKDNYPKMVVSMSPIADGVNDDGILHISLRRFLMQSGLRNE